MPEPRFRVVVPGVMIVGAEGLSRDLAVAALVAAQRDYPSAAVRLEAVADAPRGQITEEEMRGILAMRARAATYDEIGAHYRRAPASIMRALRAWCECRSRIARRARAAGRWSPEIVVPVEVVDGR